VTPCSGCGTPERWPAACGQLRTAGRPKKGRGSDRDTFRGIPLTDTQWTALVAGEWRFAARMSLVVQWLSTEGLIPGFDPFSANSDEIALGWKWELRERGILEAGVIENFVSFDNTPDVGLHVGFTQRF
jgi:hypothetical protein